MADYTREEVIEKVKRGESFAKANFSGCDLRMVDFVGIDLTEANLARQILNDNDLSRSNLTKAYLPQSHCDSTKFEGATLNRAYLLHSSFVGASFRNASLENAFLDHSMGIRADFRNANLRGAELINTNLNEANLSEADITGANIYQIGTSKWTIERIKCEYVYYAPEFAPDEEKEKTRRDFAPGEFEALYRQLPTAEVIFRQGITPAQFAHASKVFNSMLEDTPGAFRVGAFKRVPVTEDLVVTLEVTDESKLSEIEQRLVAAFQTPEYLSQVMALAAQAGQTPILVPGLNPMAPQQVSITINNHFHGPTNVAGGNITTIHTQIDNLVQNSGVDLSSELRAEIDALKEAVAQRDKAKSMGILSRMQNGLNLMNGGAELGERLATLVNNISPLF